MNKPIWKWVARDLAITKGHFQLTIKAIKRCHIPLFKKVEIKNKMRYYYPMAKRKANNSKWWPGWGVTGNLHDADGYIKW